MEHELVQIDVVSVAKIYGFITAALVAVFSFPFAFVDVMAPTGFGLATWVMLIVVTGITGALMGAIGPIVYNVLADTVGVPLYDAYTLVSNYKLDRNREVMVADLTSSVPVGYDVLLGLKGDTSAPLNL